MTDLTAAVAECHMKAPHQVLQGVTKYDPSEPRDDQGQWTDGGGSGGAEGKPLSEAKFYRHYVQHTDLRGREKGTAMANREAIMRDGFKPVGGVNAIPPWRGGEPNTVVDTMYGKPRVGDVVYLAPKGQWQDAAIGLKIKAGWKPLPHEAIVVTDPNKSMYENYLAAFKSPAKKGEDVRKGFDPSEPRDQDGKWTDGGGGAAGDASGAAELGQSVEDDAAFEEGYSPWPRHHEPRLSEEDTGTLHGAQFASPSITDKDFNQASEAIHGERQQAFGRASQEIDKELGMEGVRNTDVIGAWADGAENSTMAEIRRPGSLEALRVSAAMKGALANQKAVLIFQTDPRGQDSLYQLALKGEPAEVHDQLLKAGIPFHTLNKIPGYSGETGVTVVDQGGELHQKIGEFADAHKTLALEFNGHAEFLGDAQGTGSDAEQRSRAQDAYAKVIEGATSSYQGRTAGAVWQGVRDRWAKQIEVLKRGYRSFTERLLERREL